MVTVVSPISDTPKRSDYEVINVSTWVILNLPMYLPQVCITIPKAPNQRVGCLFKFSLKELHLYSEQQGGDTTYYGSCPLDTLLI